MQDGTTAAPQTFSPDDEMNSRYFDAPLTESLSLCKKFLAVALVCEETNEKQHSNLRVSWAGFLEFDNQAALVGYSALASESWAAQTHQYSHVETW